MDQKIDILKTHWLPLVMPTRHRPDLDNAALWRAQGSEKLLQPVPFDEPGIENSLWPYFNLETLTSPDKALLQLMESRSDLHPRFFTRLDLIDPINKRLQSHFGIDIEPSRWNSLARFAGFDPRAGDMRDPDSSYGALISVSNASVMNALQTIESFSEQEGDRVMKVQRRIYDYLGKICDDVLEEEEEAPGQGTTPRATASGAAKPPDTKRRKQETSENVLRLKPILDFEPSDPNKEEALQRYLKLHHDLDPYSHPAEVDWEYLGVLAHHQLHISEGRLRGLKENPGKFLDYLQQVRDHSTSMLIFHPSNDEDSLVKKGTDLVNKKRLAQHLQTAFSTLTDAVDTWQTIFSLVEKLRDMRHGHDGSHVDLLENSDEYATYMLGIIRAGHHYKSNSVDLKRTIGCSQYMRGYFRISEITFDIEPLGPLKPKNNAERTLIALASTLGNQTTRDVFGEWTIFEEVHALLKGNPRLSTPYLAGIAQDLNSLSSRLRELNVEDAHGVLQSLVQDYLKRPLKDNYTFKTQGRMSKRDYEANEKALGNLAGFWDAAEVMLGTEEVAALSDTVKELLAEAQPLTVPKPPSAAKKKTKTTTNTLAKTEVGSSTFTTTGSSNDTPRMTFEERRVKEKTRPEIVLRLAVPAPAALPAHAVYPNIQLPLQHYNTIQMLMGPNSAARPGTISWAAVVGCLGAMGFSYNTSQGSARVFVPSTTLMASQGVVC
ncbi:hypothetical protein N0V82_005463 [Gnomoniopsis sp. IMI 355080]|nr:hypothetical protein N0V82_005463 [Gnomoniopsis sp. IMI 355080]